MNTSLVICDQEEGYARALAAYLMRRTELPFSVRVCSSPSQVRRLQEREPVGVLLHHDAFLPEEGERLEAECRIILTESGNCRLQADEYPLYRLQPGDRMLAGIMEACSRRQQGMPESLWRGAKDQIRITGVFSPVHRSGRTSWAIRRGEELAALSHVLYLNLELYGGAGGIFPREGNTLADLLYYSRQEEQNLGWVLTSMVSHMGDLDYLLPVRVSEDIRKVTAKEWQTLIRQITQAGMYDVVILDIDDGLPECYEILRMCTEICVPVLSDETARAKLEQMEEELRLLGYEDVRRRMQKIEVIR